MCVVEGCKKPIGVKKSSMCKPCHKRDYDQRTAERRRERERILNKKKKDALSEYKLQTGCVDCGYNKCAAALEFDHINPSSKSFDVSQCWNKSERLIWEEVAKCEVRCANCHAEITEERRLAEG